MKLVLVFSAILVLAVSFLLYQPQQAQAVPISYNQTQINLNLNSITRSNLDVFVDAGNNGTITQWYNGTYGSSVMFLKLGAAASGTGTAGGNGTYYGTYPTTSLNGGQAIGSSYHLRFGELFTSGSTLIGQQVTGVYMSVYKVGAPAGTAQIVIRDSTKASTGVGVSVPLASLNTFGSIQPLHFIFNGTRTIHTNDTITVEYSGGSGVDYLQIGAGSVGLPSNTIIDWYEGGVWRFNNAPTDTMFLVYTTPTTNSSSIMNLACAPDSTTQANIANGSNVYYACSKSVNHVNIVSRALSHDFSTSCTPVQMELFHTRNKIMSWCFPSAGNSIITTSSGNTSSVAVTSSVVYSNQKIGTSTSNSIRENYNSTTPGSMNTDPCDLLLVPTNATIKIQDIACDKSLPTSGIRFWQGLAISKSATYYTNTENAFITTVNHSPYKNILTLAPPILGINVPYVDFILHANSNNYLVIVTANTIYYKDVNTINQILNLHYAFQTYQIVIPSTTTNNEIPVHGNNTYDTVPMYIYGSSGLNSTFNYYGLITVPSGYTLFESSLPHNIRIIDPQWSYLATQNYPIINTNGTALFQVLLTVSNAPTDAALMVTNPYQLINGTESIWSLSRLDSTHSVEFDIPPNQCANLYVTSIATYPSVWTYEGNVCSTGANQKTVAYTNTLPTTFYTMAYGATSSYNPVNNALTVTTRSATSPFTYNVVIKNSTGAVTQNFTQISNSTLISHVFNVSNTNKPGAVYVSIPTIGVIYSAYMGSSLSLATAAAFFHQYFNYQGFDLLSFIPLIFASMFTRNTVGIGMALVVVVVASLSFLSIVVVSDTTVFIMIVIAAIGMIGYRSIWG